MPKKREREREEKEGKVGEIESLKNEMKKKDIFAHKRTKSTAVFIVSISNYVYLI